MFLGAAPYGYRDFFDGVKFLQWLNLRETCDLVYLYTLQNINFLPEIAKKLI
jgi:hypothetical protein